MCANKLIAIYFLYTAQTSSIMDVWKETFSGLFEGPMSNLMEINGVLGYGSYFLSMDKSWE